LPIGSLLPGSRRGTAANCCTASGSPRNRPGDGTICSAALRSASSGGPTAIAAKGGGKAEQAGDSASLEVLARPPIDAVLVGASGITQLESDIAAADGPTPDEETMAACDEVWHELRGPAPHYNR